MVILKHNEIGYYIEDECSGNIVKLTIEDLLEFNSATTRAVENLLNF